MGPKLKNQKKLSQKQQEKQDRSTKYINQRKKDSYLADDNNFQQFSNQLSKLGFELRDITGDGNCLFRALSDQLEGNENNHLLYRRQVCDYMRKNRADFEPFVVGLVEEIEHKKRGGGNNNKKDKNENLDPFDQYVNNLEQSGTYGGNDALVAFSRLHEVDIYLHQLDQPVWKVNGAFSNAKNVKQLHLSYHNGEHYSSIRRMGDTTNIPANIQINTVESTNTNSQSSNKKDKKSSNNNYYNNASYYDYDENLDDYNDFTNETATSDYINNHENIINESNVLNDLNGLKLEASNNIDKNNDLHNLESILDNIINITNCYDVNLIKEVYNENNNNVELTITRLLSIVNTNDTDKNVTMADGDDDDDDDDKNDGVVEASGGSSKSKPKKLSAREKKYLKKQRKTERDRLKVYEERESERLKNTKANPGKISAKCEDNEHIENSASSVCNNNNNNNQSGDCITITNIEAKSI